MRDVGLAVSLGIVTVNSRERGRELILLCGVRGREENSTKKLERKSLRDKRENIVINVSALLTCHHDSNGRL